MFKDFLGNYKKNLFGMKKMLFFLDAQDFNILFNYPTELRIKLFSFLIFI